MSTFIKSGQSAPNLLRASPISRSGFVHPDQRVITGLTCIDFQDGGHGGHLGFLIRTILAIFDLQVTLMLPTKFRVK